MDSPAPNLFHRIWKSVNRHRWSLAPLDRSLAMTSNIFLHLHPVKISQRSLRFSYTMGLGVISLVSFIILTVTGVLLMFHYVPSVERAYSGVVELQTTVPFGQLLRNMHRWAAHLMVLVTVLHMLRVFYTGAYKPPREFNWVVGCVLLLLTLVASFTGYLLPWDQLAFWAITVGTSVASYEPVMGPTVAKILLGGVEVGQESLIRFYTLHIAVIPLAIALLIALHMWRVRKDGGLAVTDLPQDETNSNPVSTL